MHILRNACFLFLPLLCIANSSLAQNELWLPKAQPTRPGIAPQAAAVAPPRSVNLRLMFTDYLLGYYRIPETQTSELLTGCDTANADGPSGELVNNIKQNRNGAVLVGMGQNFAVEFGSRNYRKDGIWHAKQRVLDEKALSNSVIQDNVGCFLYRAGYDAIVPGKEDFYFGAERLRGLAHQLETVSQDKTRVLAANLVIATDYWKKPASILDIDRELAFKPEMPDGVKSLDIADGDSVLPYKRLVRFEIETEVGKEKKKVDVGKVKASLCPAKKEGHPEAVDFASCTELPNRSVSQDPKSEKMVLTYQLNPGQIKTGENWGLCVEAPDQGGGPCRANAAPHRYTIRFSVAEPFLDCGQAGNCSRTPPYQYIKEKNVVIFGVVDPELHSFVSQDNLSWRNHDSQFKTEVSAIDPASALKQAVQFFCLTEDVDCRTVQRVLLAEMDRENAEELAAHTGFDVVLTRGTEFSRSTTNRTTCLKSDPDAQDPDRDNEFPAVVITPWKGYDRGRKHLVNPLRVLDVVDGDSTCGLQRRLATLSGDRYDMPWEEKADPSETLRSMAQDYIQKHYGKHAAEGCAADADAKDSCFTQMVLALMRQHSNADVALLQKRDLYFGKFHQAANTGEDIDRVIWKGDRLRVISAKGSTLQKILDESDSFEQLDTQKTRYVSEHDRGLIALGIDKTTDGDYLVAGNKLDPDRLYTVAATSHITSGDTGYPELNDPDVVPPGLTPEPSGAGDARAEGQLISELVCAQLAKEHTISGPTTDQCVIGSSANVAPVSDRKPVQLAPDLEERFKAWRRTNLTAAKPQSEAGSIEDKVQNQPTTRLSVTELSIDVSRAHNNISEEQRTQRLTGVSEPGISSAAKSHSFAFANSGELVRSGRHLDEYFRGRLEYSSTVTGNTQTVNFTDANGNPGSKVVRALPSVSRDKNRATFDVGFLLHRGKSDPKWSIVLQPFRFDTPLHQEELPVDAHFDQAGNVDRKAFVVPLERTRRILSREGLRFAGGSNHFEVGYQAGVETNALDSLLFNIPGGGTGSCLPTAQQTLLTCLTNQGAQIDPDSVRQVRDTRKRFGPYADVSWTLPIPFMKKFSLVEEDQFEYFSPAHNDNPTDTLMRNDWKNTLKMPIWNNLSFEPGIELLYYENKIARTSLFRWTPTFKIDYTFDWFSGGDIKRALRYGPSK